MIGKSIRKPLEFMVMINDWIFHRKSIGQAHGPLHKFPPRHLVAEIYVVAYPPVQCFFDGKSNRVIGPLKGAEGDNVRGRDRAYTIRIGRSTLREM